MRGGFFPVWRDDMDRMLSEEGKDAFVLWMELLRRAAYEPGDAETSHGLVALQPGELIFSRRGYADRLRLSPSFVRDKIARWKAIGRLSTRPLPVARPAHGRDHPPTLLSIEHWHRYTLRGTQQDHLDDHVSSPADGRERPEEERDQRRETSERRTTPPLPGGVENDEARFIRRVTALVAPHLIPSSRDVTEWLSLTGGDRWALAAMILSEELGLKHGKQPAYLRAVIERKVAEEEPIQEPRAYVEHRLKMITSDMTESGGRIANLTVAANF